MNGQSPVGASVPRVDGVAKVTGRAMYLDDLDAPGVWYGATVRSVVPHGILESIELDPTFPWSRRDRRDGRRYLPARTSSTMLEDDQPALVPIGARVMHVDEPLALVAAPTKAMAIAAMKAVRPIVRELSADLHDRRGARRRAAALQDRQHLQASSLLRKGHTTDDELEAAFASAARVIEGTYQTSPQEQMYIEHARR